MSKKRGSYHNLNTVFKVILIFISLKIQYINIIINKNDNNAGIPSIEIAAIVNIFIGINKSKGCTNKL